MSDFEADKVAITNIVDVYSKAISRSDAEALVSLFTQDGVVMAPEAPTMEGADQITAFFSHSFTMVRLDAKIYVDEIVGGGDNAFARCHSDVQLTLIETNTSHHENNRELFLFRKENDVWKIARYMFNKMPSSP